MARILIENVTDNHEQWIAQKLDSIGSGDIATIANANRFMSPLELWAIKTRRQKPIPDNDHMWWGRVMEPSIAKLAEYKCGRRISYPNTLFGHSEIAWATATPDYYLWPMRTEEPDDPSRMQRLNEDGSWEKIADPEILECKNVGYRSAYMWREETPLAPRIQVLWQLGVTGLQNGKIAPLLGGDIGAFELRDVQYDHHIFCQLAELADRFMWHVRTDTPPAPRDTDTKLVEAIVGALEEKTVALPDECEVQCLRYRQLEEQASELNRQLKTLKKQQDVIKNELRLQVGNATKAVCGSYTINLKEVVIEPYMNKGSRYTRFAIKNRDDLLDEKEE